MFDLSADDDSTGSGDEFSCAATGGFSIGSMSLSIGSLSFNLWLMIMVEIISWCSGSCNFFLNRGCGGRHLLPWIYSIIEW